ncbi:uncharacterized protein DUF1893 [Keratinibaculum paraultunense]|uniref:Uncharacterized protein DUF1893 n=1 Tax=Keratinibaculum paraultunense TaxID=1278232 RepID=A0A4R3L0V2_9FIRM|nr:DUF1893 domain-containing protein [Keratinibaculum paraultunense]QQY80016.1 DUF1893 domain-containing protein [Keratinibaculum paraultunense]TCS91661.1 uncharacterized protein DUF1893 [Keratinibaculum paraultunense]
MKDIELAKKYLEEDNLALAVVKNGELIYKSQEKGIKPMYFLAINEKGILKGTSIADKVIGKGAAMLCSYIGAKELYAQLISEGAIKVLEEENIVYTYDRICPYIKNREKSDMCPVEKIATNVDDMETLLGEIGKLLKGRV